jgi:hypothetical protein
MDTFRLIKPTWAKKKIKNKGIFEDNPDFVREIIGPDVLGDKNFDLEYVTAQNEIGYNVYYFPNYSSNPPNNEFLQGSNVDVFTTIFMDMDLKDGEYKSKEEFYEVVSGFPIKPSYTLDSGNGVHVYWNCTDLTREKYMEGQFRLIQAYKTDASVWTVLQLMRYPLSKNTKDPNNFKQTTFVQELTSGESYKIEDILAHLPALDPQNKIKIERHINALEGRADVTVDETLDKNELPEKFKKELEINKEISNLFYKPAKTAGDRSSADMKLANYLWNLDYDRDEALQVMLNTEKARGRTDRLQYAHTTLDKVYSDRGKFLEFSAGDALKHLETVPERGRPVHGPKYWDALTKPWRTTHLLGMIGGSGTGKTSTTLQLFKSFIEKTPGEKEVFLFFSLEMPQTEIIERWVDLTGGGDEYMNRFYVIGNEDYEGNPRNIGLQEIYWFCRDIQKNKGQKVKAIAIDHLTILSRHINMKKNPTFNAMGGGREYSHDDNVVLTAQAIVAKFKDFAKQLDLFVVLQSQTTKDKDGGGDLPLGKNAAYGISGFEWYCDYIMTFWRPIKRVQDDTNLRVMAWQYAKIRHTHKDDTCFEGQPYLLGFKPENGEFYNLSTTEELIVRDLTDKANKLRKMEENKQTTNYKLSPVGRSLSKLYSVKKG